MLFLVLLLVLAALGLLVTALITSTSLFAWISIGLSVAAALVLFFDWLSRSAKSRRTAEDAESAEQADDAKGADAEQPAADDDKRTTTDKPPEKSENPDKSEKPEAEEPEKPENDAAPGEENTDAADLLIVCDLDDPVVVVDEYPRYHLSACRWLMNRDTIPIAVSEARELGFTPCARCTPDAKLAAQARKKRVADSD